MDEFCAELDRQRRAFISNGVDATADPVARLEHDSLHSRFAEASRGGEAGDPRSYDDDVRAFWHPGSERRAGAGKLES
jgi:hypothetical protein